MDALSNDAVENFKAFTGCKNDSEAKQLIEACGGDVEAAVDLFFHQQQPSSSNGSNEPSSSRRRTAHQPKFVQQPLRRSTRNASNNNLKRKKNVQEEEIRIDDDDEQDDDYVRPPIMPVRGPIVEQSFQEQYQRPRRIQTNSVFESFRDYQPGEDSGPAFLGMNGMAMRRSALQNLFRPPFDILFNGSWEGARAEAERLSVWLLVNVQNVQEFACQALNRDVWSNGSVKEMIKSNFLFWQVYHDSTDGIRIQNYYQITSYPAIFVVDPRTGELLEHFRAPDPAVFCDQVGSFLNANPDFATRDRRIASDAGSSMENGFRNHVNDDDVDMPQCSSNGIRKRRRDSSEESVPNDHSQDSCVKKARREDAPDVEEILDKGNKLTTIDSDEWIKYLGVPDGKGNRIALLLKFPDGSRKKIDVEDTTPLKAAFLLAAGLGYAQHDHMLTMFYPKREYLLENGDQTMRELNFNKQEVIHIERR